MVFQADGVRISNRFAGARMNRCERLGDGRYRILIAPENSPINPSPWFAFKVRARKEREVEITLRYQNATHRYQPKISRDGTNWITLPNDRIRLSPRRTEATLRLDVGPEPLRIAGQELLGVRQLRTWMKQLASRSDVTRTKIGESFDGRRLDGLQFGSANATNFVVIVSRQHPPEVTGSIALMTFVEKLLTESDAANEFRQHLGVMLVPLMNPDGVKEGHWRHNLAGVDLNRDWREFRQPETRAVRDWIERTMKQRTGRPLLFLDFHSTRYDVFYTQKDEHPTVPKDFTKHWLAALTDRLPQIRIRRSASHNMEKPTSKAWAYDRFGCPAITCEYGDQTGRSEIRKQAAVAAEEVMRLLTNFADN